MTALLKYSSRVSYRVLSFVLLLSLSGCDVLYKNQSPAPVSGSLGGRGLGTVAETYNEPEKKRSFFWSRKEGADVDSGQNALVGHSLTFKEASAPVVALISEAQRNINLGSLDVAAATVERALRLEPRNAHVMIKLTEIRIKQGKAVMAEQLAEKTLSLSQGKNVLKKRCWLLIAKARHLQGNQQGAAQAEHRARQY